ncbi:MAG: glycerophosphodiester phosphodiesterase [Chloroflexota bacterium]|nr:glycerophosphodiester phosphodiesterase [Chloroflexota bacterium]
MNGPRSIEVVGHRGAAAYQPGNSRAAVETALCLGVDRVEGDVRRAADGTLVLVHDEQVTLPDGSSRPVEKLSTNELRLTLPGFLTLDDWAALLSNRAFPLIDAKRPGDEGTIAAAIERHGWVGTALVSTTDPRTVRRLRAAHPSLRVGLSTGHWAGSAPLALGRAAGAALRLLLPVLLPPVLRLTGATEAMLHHRVATRRLVARVHGGGRQVYVWTVNDPVEVRRVATLGVSGITSDRPDMVRRVLAEATNADGSSS